MLDNIGLLEYFPNSEVRRATPYPVPRSFCKINIRKKKEKIEYNRHTANQQIKNKTTVSLVSLNLKSKTKKFSTDQK